MLLFLKNCYVQENNYELTLMDLLYFYFFSFSNFAYGDIFKRDKVYSNNAFICATKSDYGYCI